MKLLFICIDPYPESGACTNLLDKLFFAGGLNKRNEIHVLTRFSSFDEPSEIEYKGVSIHRIFAWSLMSISTIKMSFMRKPGMSCKCLFLKAIDKIMHIIDHSLFYSAIDEKYIRKKIINLQRKFQYDAIIPVAGYFSVVAAAISIDNLKSSILTYLVDPCSTNATLSPQSKHSREAFEKRIAERSKTVITTPLMYKEYLKRCDLRIHNFKSLEFPNVSPKSYITIDREEKKSINIVYIGRLYAGRDPQYLFDLVDKMNRPDITLYMVGVAEDEIKNLRLSGNIVFTGLLPISQLKEYYDKADFFINLGNEMTNQVPSKLFEYISSGKPIINICKNSNCPTLNYLSKYPLAISIIENEKSINNSAEILSEFLNANNGILLSAEQIEHNFYSSTPIYCANKFEEYLRE